MFQRKIDEIFEDLPNVFGIADDILVVGYETDGKDHDDTVCRVLQRCRQVSLKLNKDKCHSVVRQSHPQKIKALMEMSTPKNKKELQAFLGIINCLGKFSPSTTSICEPLRKLMSSKTLWTWNASYHIRPYMMR